MDEKVLNHSLLKSIFLHLLPGILTALAYFLLVPFVREIGYHSIMALILAGLITVFPFEFGISYFQKKHKVIRFYNGVITYCILNSLDFFTGIISTATL